MKPAYLSLAVFSLLLFISCKKELSKQNQFIKSFKADFDLAAVASFQMNDGNYLIAGFDQLNIQSGQLLKLDASGEMIWEKPLTPLIKIIWSAFPVPSSGFVTFGIHDYDSHAMYMCLYDNNGNLLSTDSIVTGAANYDKTPYNMMLLTNGNYVMAGGLSLSPSYGVRILSPTFQVLTSHSYIPPAGMRLTYCKAMCELPDASIGIAATVSVSNGDRKNLFLVKTDLDGNFITSNFIEDTIHSETANVIAPHNGGILAITGKMTGFSFGGDVASSSNDGIAVNYYGSYNDYGRLISGTINLDQFTTDAQLTSAREIHDYPNNGMMNSIRTTNDGGYILCGTVNQQSTYLVESDTKIYLLKLNADLNEQWSKIIYTTYPSYGVDAMQTSDGGYLVTGFHKTLGKRFEAMVIKTDASGNFN